MIYIYIFIGTIFTVALVAQLLAYATYSRKQMSKSDDFDD